MMICFDWIFPESARTLALLGADIIAHPSNLVMSFCQEAMITRALENSVFTITSNRVGADSTGEREIAFTGRSRIVAPHGEVLASADGREERLVLVDIDYVEARDKRITTQNDLMLDRRPEFYKTDNSK